MIAKLLEAFFRNKLLVLLPLFLVPAIVTPIAFITNPAYYESSAGIWVDRPTYLNVVDDTNRYITPAQNQAGRLIQLLGTRSFQVDVVQRTALAPLVGSISGETRLRDIFTKDLTVTATGNNVLVVRLRGQTAQLSYEVLSAVIDTFKQRLADGQVSQADLATSFYQSRFQTAQDQLRKANDALRRYAGAHPEVTTASNAPGPVAAVDPQFAQLQSSAQLAQEEVNRAGQALDQAQLQTSASLEGQDLGVQIVDPPMLPTAPTRDQKKLLVLPVASVIVGLALSLILLVLLAASDRTVRAATDLVPPVRVLGAIPQLNGKRLPTKAPTKAPAAAARAAVGFVAGAALPAPRAHA